MQLSIPLTTLKIGIGGMVRFQSKKSSCGPTALANALESVGIKRSEDELCKLSRQTTDGTNSRGLEKALKSIGVTATRLHERRAEVAGCFLWAALNAGTPAVLLVDDFSHWVSVVGLIGKRYVVADSADNELLLFYKEDELLERWCSGDRYYGIVIGG